jgi:hypothetical protein
MACRTSHTVSSQFRHFVTVVAPFIHPFIASLEKQRVRHCCCFEAMAEQDDNGNESFSKNQSFGQQSAQEDASSTNRHSRPGSVGGDDGSVASSWAPPPFPGQRVETPTRLSPQRQTFQATKEQHPFSQTAPEKTRLTDQLMAGTLELLKMAGGVTLSTTGKLASPPLHVTRTVLLPALWQTLADYLTSVTPLRVKDWFRILWSSVHHIISVIGNTNKGKIFQNKLCTVSGGLLDCVSSDVSRQALMDGMASVVKLNEALHTPQVKALLEQLSVLACRLVDVAASGRNKKLLHNVSDAAWAGLELMSDPSCTLALAEVTAYLCYALEMEDALHREEVVPVDRKRAAQRRHERNAYQKQTYVDPNLTTDANSTVEQVLLSSLGEITTGRDEASFPSNVILNTHGEQSAPVSEKDWLQGEAEEEVDGFNWAERAKDDIDLPLLHERITARAAELQRQRAAQRKSAFIAQQEQNPTQEDPPKGRQSVRRHDDDIEEIIVATVDENDNNAVEYHVEETRGEEDQGESPTTRTPGNAKSKKRDLEYENRETQQKQNDDEIQDWLLENGETPPPPVTPVGGRVGEESASGCFYRRLDEIMLKKRAEAVTDILNRHADGKLSWFPKAAAAAGAGNEHGQDTIKNRVAAMRSEIGVGRQQRKLAKQQKKAAARTISIGEMMFGVVTLFWFVLGLYGFYALVFSRSTALPVAMSRSNVPQEIVIRIVREVVHVGADGNVIQSDQYPPLSEKTVDDVAACVARAME